MKDEGPQPFEHYLCEIVAAPNEMVGQIFRVAVGQGKSASTFLVSTNTVVAHPPSSFLDLDKTPAAVHPVGAGT